VQLLNHTHFQFHGFKVGEPISAKSAKYTPLENNPPLTWPFLIDLKKLQQPMATNWSEKYGSLVTMATGNKGP
jgi:hypothetical protein